MATDKISLRIEGMSCEHCRCRVEGALMKAPGVRAVAVDLDTGTAIVTVGEGAPSASDLAEVVREVGYQVTPAAG